MDFRLDRIEVPDNRWVIEENSVHKTFKPDYDPVWRDFEVTIRKVELAQTFKILVIAGSTDSPLEERESRSAETLHIEYAAFHPHDVTKVAYAVQGLIKTGKVQDNGSFMYLDNEDLREAYIAAEIPQECFRPKDQLRQPT